MGLTIIAAQERFKDIQTSSQARRFIQEAGDFLGDWGMPLQVSTRSSLDVILKVLYPYASFDTIGEEPNRTTLHIITPKEKSVLVMKYENSPRYCIAHGSLHIMQNYGDNLWIERQYTPLSTATKKIELGDFAIPDNFLDEF